MDFADIIKLIILRWGGYPGLSKWVLSVIMYPHKREMEGDNAIDRKWSNMMTEARYYLLGFEDGRRVPEPKKARNAPLEDGCQENDALQDPLEGAQPWFGTSDL